MDGIFYGGIAGTRVIPVFLTDPLTNLPITGLTNADIVATYKRDPGGTLTTIGTIASTTVGHAWGGTTTNAAFVEVGSGNYELHLPSNSYLIGAAFVTYMIKDTSGNVLGGAEFQLMGRAP